MYPRTKNSTFLIKFIFSISFLIPAFLASPIIAKGSEGLYNDQFQSGMEVLVVSNYAHKMINGQNEYIYEIKSDPELSFYKATHLLKDSLQVNEIEYSLMLSEMKKKKGDWLIYIHGYGKTFESAVWQAMDIQHLYGVNVLVFCWPSMEEAGNGISLKNSISKVNGSLAHFNQLLELIKNFKSAPEFDIGTKISLLNHSLGNQFMKALPYSEFAKNLPTDLFDNLILNAAAVDQKEHKNWVELLNIQKRIYITINLKDFNLRGLRIFTKAQRQLGEKIKHPMAINANYVQFNKSVGFMFPTYATHTYFLGEIPNKKKHVFDFFHAIFHGKSIDLTDNNLFAERKDKLGYEIIEPKHLVLKNNP